jgi:hypothetical protein
MCNREYRHCEGKEGDTPLLISKKKELLDPSEGGA